MSISWGQYRSQFLVLAAALALNFSGIAVGAQSNAATPWSAKASTRVFEEEKGFANGATALSGTLTLPISQQAVGAVVVTHSASEPSRSAQLYHHLKEVLPPLGIAVFIYDRRGSGKSGGNLADSDYAMLADDAVAAVRMLKADPRIDPKRVGIWGLSQGGWLSLLAATRSADVRFVVSIAAPVVTPDVQMMFRSENLLRINNYPESDIEQMRAARRAVDDYMRGSGERAEAQRRVDAIKAKPWFDELYLSQTVADRAASRWAREIAYDPLSTIDLVGVPALILYGAADPVVPVAISVERIAARQRPNISTHVVAGADHHMATTVPPEDQMSLTPGAPVRPDAAEYFAVLANWLTGQSLTTPVSTP